MKEKTENPKALNLYQKLVKVRESIGYIKKGAKGYGYSYTTESQVLLAMNEEMNKQNLFLEQEIVEKPENLDMTIKTKQGYQQVMGMNIHFQYIITDGDNPEDKITRNQWMQQPGSDAQTIGSIMTYGMKYFLFKFFNIAMDTFDIDAMDDENKVVSAKPKAAPENPPVKQEPVSLVSEAQVNFLLKQLESQEALKAEMEKFLQDNNILNWSQLPVNLYDKLLKRALKGIADEKEKKVEAKKGEKNEQV